MIWFRENRLFVIFGVCMLAAVWFFFSAKRDRDEASARFSNTASELNRLERLNPYPSADNLRKMKAHSEDYASALAKLKNELKIRAVPVPPMAPNEFQSHFRVAMNAVMDKARRNKVKLPDKFYLGFDEFVSALPNESAAPLLGRELVEIEWLMNGLLDAGVDSITAFHRAPFRETGAKPSASLAATMLERNVVELTFMATPAAARKVINQVAGANGHFCIIRLLHVRNEEDKGPPRESAEASAPSIPAATPAAKVTPAPVLSFIVGNEKIEMTAKIEMVRFTF